MPSLAPIKAYEHLGGAQGRAINYRAPRFRAGELFDGPFPFAVLNGHAHALSDLSLTGVAAFGQPNEEDLLHAGARLSLALQVGEVVLHESEVEVARVEATALGPKFGLRFLREDLDLDGLVARYREARLRAHLRENLSEAAPLPPERLQLLTARMLHVLRVCRGVLGEVRDGAPDFGEPLRVFALAELGVAWRPLAIEANRALDEALDDPAALAPLKRYVERLITPEFVAAPLWRRAFEKPLGHPADFRLSRDLAAAAPVPSTPYADLLERFGRQVFHWVSSRQDLLTEALARELGLHRGVEELRLASIGSGGALEIAALLARGRLHRRLALTLVEQDAAALAHAFREIHPHVLREPDRLTLRTLNASHAQLLEGGELHGALSGQHVVVAPTLLDYLRHRPASQMLETLYRGLTAGGTLLACFLRRHDESARWASELVCDWSMIHRTRDEIMALMQPLVRARIEIRADRRNDVYLAVLRKPRSERDSTGAKATG